MAINLGDGVIQIDGNLGPFKDAMKRTGPIAAKAISIAGVAIVGALGAATAAAANFTSQMAEVNTLGVENLAALTQGVKDVAAEFGQELGPTVKATYDIISAGVPEASALDVLAQSAKAAAAGVTDVATTVDLGTSVLNAFGLEARDMEAIFDSAFIAVKAGKTTMAELGSAVGKVAPLFNAAGLAAEDMFGAIAVLSKNGIRTSEAVSGLKAALSNIIKPTAEAEKAAAALGIEFNAASLEALGFAGFMEMVKEAAQGDVTILSDLFSSVEALNSVSVLTGAGFDDLQSVMGELRNGSGALSEAFGKFVDENPAFAFEQLKTEMKVLAIDIGTALLPVFADLLDTIKPIIRSMRDWIKENPKLFTNLVKVTAVVGGLLAIVAPLAALIAVLGTAFGVLGAAAAAMGTTIGGVAVVVLGIGTVILGLLAIFGNVIGGFDDFAGSMRVLWAFVSNLILSTMQNIAFGIGLAMGLIVQVILAPIRGIQNAWRFIVDIFRNGTQAIENLLDRTLGRIDNFLRFLSNTLRRIQEFGAAAGEAVGFFEHGGIVNTPLQIVGERGPELIAAPRGSRVFTASDTRAMLAGAGAGGGGSITIQGPLIGTAHIASNMDVDQIGRRLIEKTNAALMGRGIRPFLGEGG